jgi:probable H4MPT-linked C1 transfer pathway protein
MRSLETGAIIGWDIGGVNLKAARLDTGGFNSVHIPFAIWQRQADLVDTLRQMSEKLGHTNKAAITITAELSDAFRTKREGIRFVLDAVQTALPDTHLHIFGVDGRFYPLSKAIDQSQMFAAANWLATALLVAQHFPDGLLVDIGSTTADIIPISAGQVVAAGRNDPERLVRGELLYTGALRTPVFAVVQQVPLWGRWCPVAAEFFATMQDVYLWLERLTPQECTSPTADGRPVSMQFCAERLARVVCADTELLVRDEITILARHVAQTQLYQITRAIDQVCSTTRVNGPVIGVGVGAFLAEQAAQQLNLSFIRPIELLGTNGLTVAPAAAVAVLLAQQEAHV